MNGELVQRYEKYFHFFVGKLAIFKKDKENWQVLLVKRKGEKEYDNTYSFPGGRKEFEDDQIMDNLIREKNEELGKDFKIRVFPTLATTLAFKRKDNIPVVGAVYPALYESGMITLCEDYWESVWVDVDKVISCEPRTPNLEEEVGVVLRLIELSEQGAIETHNMVI